MIGGLAYYYQKTGAIVIYHTCAALEVVKGPGLCRKGISTDCPPRLGWYKTWFVSVYTITENHHVEPPLDVELSASVHTVGFTVWTFFVRRAWATIRAC